VKKRITSLLALGALASPVAFAAPIVLPANSPLYIQYTNSEQVSLANNIGNTSGSGAVWNEGNWGILRVTSIGVGVPAVTPPNYDIGPPSGANFFNNQAVNNGQITGIFYGLNFTADPLRSTGGFLDLYWDDAGLANTMINPQTELNGGIANIAAKRTAQDQYTGVTDGIFLVRMEFKPGILTDVGDGVTTVSSTANPSTGNGDAQSYQSVVTGATNYNGATGIWDDILNGNWFLNSNGGNPLIAGPQDFFTRSTFTQNNSWDDGAVQGVQGLSSSDPTRGFTVPEPGSTALLGTALLGLAALGRKNRRSKVGE
jgi:hypothetical protein